MDLAEDMAGQRVVGMEDYQQVDSLLEVHNLTGRKTHQLVKETRVTGLYPKQSNSFKMKVGLTEMHFIADMEDIPCITCT